MLPVDNPLGQGPRPTPVLLSSMPYCYRVASGRYLAEVSNLHCATSRQVLTDTPSITSSGNPRLSGMEDEKGEAEVVTASFSSAFALKLTVYSKSQFVSCFHVGSFDLEFGICF